MVGPEGGLTDEEVAAFADAGAHAVRLGPEVLRTSTAGVAAVAALLARTRAGLTPVGGTAPVDWGLATLERDSPGELGNPRAARSAGQQALDPGDLVVEVGPLGLGERAGTASTTADPAVLDAPQAVEPAVDEDGARPRRRWLPIQACVARRRVTRSRPAWESQTLS